MSSASQRGPWLSQCGLILQLSRVSQAPLRVSLMKIWGVMFTLWPVKRVNAWGTFVRRGPALFDVVLWRICFMGEASQQRCRKTQNITLQLALTFFSFLTKDPLFCRLCMYIGVIYYIISKSIYIYTLSMSTQKWKWVTAQWSCDCKLQSVRCTRKHDLTRTLQKVCIHKCSLCWSKYGKHFRI